MVHTFSEDIADKHVYVKRLIRANLTEINTTIAVLNDVAAIHAALLKRGDTTPASMQSGLVHFYRRIVESQASLAAMLVMFGVETMESELERIRTMNQEAGNSA